MIIISEKVYAAPNTPAHVILSLILQKTDQMLSKFYESMDVSFDRLEVNISLENYW